MLIVITGLDGSGTSSLSEELHKLDQGSILMKTPGPEYPDRQVMDTIIRDESKTANMLYYLSSVVYASDYIKNHYDIEKQMFMLLDI